MISSCFHSRRSGFTLIEMMVTLGCIALLAGLILGVAGKAQAAMHTTKCASHLRQIGMAAMQWSADNDGRIVPVYNPDEGYGLSYKHWTGQLAPYLGKTLSTTVNSFASASEMPVYCCPLRPQRFGYSYNSRYLSWIYPAAQVNQWVRYAQVTEPSRTVMLVDSYQPGNTTAWRPFARPPSSSSTDFIPEFRHGGNTANVLWVDGHVTAEKSTSDLMNADDRMWKVQK